MKRLLILAWLCGLCMPGSLLAGGKEKVVESSSKHKPEWIGRSDASSLAVTEVGETLSEASDRCLATIRQHIINAVAVNVSSQETMTSHQVTCDNLVSFMNEYSSQVTTGSAPLPYLNNISLAGADEIYWERIYNKSNRSYRYEYSVRYPFTEQMRKELVSAFLRIDNARTADLDRLRSGVDTIENIDRIRQAINELNGLSDYFFDAVRKRETETVRQNYLDLYRQISIIVESESLGSCLYSLQLNGRRVTTSVAPRLSSESAIGLQVRAAGEDCWLLTYDPSYASPDDINRIEILYQFGGSRVSKSILFDPAEKHAMLQAVGTLHVEQGNGRLQGTILLRITGNGVQLTRLTLNNPADGSRLEARLSEAQTLLPGERNVGFTADGMLGMASMGLAVIRGTVVYTNTADGSSSEADFTLPLKLTIQ